MENINQDFSNNQNQINNQNFGNNPFNRIEAPNAIAVLILGILSILLSCGYGIGFIPAIIALVLGSPATKELKLRPMAYTEESVRNLKAGRICAFVGLGLSIVFFIVLAFFIGLAVIGSQFH